MRPAGSTPTGSDDGSCMEDVADAAAGQFLAV